MDTSTRPSALLKILLRGLRKPRLRTGSLQQPEHPSAPSFPCCLPSQVPNSFVILIRNCACQAPAPSPGAGSPEQQSPEFLSVLGTSGLRWETKSAFQHIKHTSVLQQLGALRGGPNTGAGHPWLDSPSPNGGAQNHKQLSSAPAIRAEPAPHSPRGDPPRGATPPRGPAAPVPLPPPWVSTRLPEAGRLSPGAL